jgi:hypothetical protein
VVVQKTTGSAGKGLTSHALGTIGMTVGSDVKVNLSVVYQGTEYTTSATVKASGLGKMTADKVFSELKPGGGTVIFSK